MARYIDADKIDFSPLKDAFDRARAKVIIMGQPTADVVEVKRGCWIVDKERQILRVRHTKPIRSLAYKCSECGCKSGNNKYLKYCHGCGAKMDERRDT